MRKHQIEGARFWQDGNETVTVQETSHAFSDPYTVALRTRPIGMGRELDDDTAQALLEVALDAHARALDIIEAYNDKEDHNDDDR